MSEQQDHEHVEHDEQQQQQQEEATGNEAAKYRRRLREAEAERDALKGTLDRIRREQIEAAVAERLHRPADFFEMGEAVDIADLLTDDGKVDTAKVNERLDALTTERPYIVKEQSQEGSAGLSPRGVGDKGEITWKDAIT